MRILYKYIAKHIVIGVALVSLVIVGLDFIFSFLNELLTLKNDYRILDALRFAFYTLPAHFYYYMPFTVLIGSLIGLGVMEDHNELTIMRAAGVSIARISFAVLLPVTIILLLNMGMGEYPTPQLQLIAETQRMVLRNGDDTVSSQSGFWRRDGNDFINFNAVDPTGKLYGVTVYDFDDARHLQKVIHAKNAEFNAADNQWRLYAIQEVTLTPSGTHLQQYESQAWKVTIPPVVLQTMALEPSDQSIHDLKNFITYFSEQGMSVDQYLLALWNKLLQPFKIISLTLISLSFVFGSLRTSTMGLRVFCGLIVGLVFEYGENMLESISLVYGLSPLYAVIIPILFCAGIGFTLMRKVG